MRHNHERPDGTGYPDQLKGEDVPLLARILSVVDVYDALTTERPYRLALPTVHAVRELREEAAKGWQFEELVEEFIILTVREDFQELSLADSARAPRVSHWRTSI